MASARATVHAPRRLVRYNLGDHEGDHDLCELALHCSRETVTRHATNDSNAQRKCCYCGAHGADRREDVAGADLSVCSDLAGSIPAHL